MIEKILYDYLNENLEVAAYLEQPENKPEQYVLIEKTGSSRTNFINRATVAIQSYAASMYNAAELNETVKETMYNLAALNEICSVRLNSDYNFTDTTRKGYRYQAVFNIVHY